MGTVHARVRGPHPRGPGGRAPRGDAAGAPVVPGERASRTGAGGRGLVTSDSGSRGRLSGRPTPGEGLDSLKVTQRDSGTCRGDLSAPCSGSSRPQGQRVKSAGRRPARAQGARSVAAVRGP